MKKLKKLTRKQKEILMENELDPREYLLERQDDKNSIYTFVHRETKEKLELSYK
ncbi:DUF6906 family protein [Romboutsia sp. 1001713B170131_170501_G6]|uniref:DUF6906 family protein n=1 Tax=Romboutsia sp. 1001713B170131_170501_G6 TaxID=2787108 RepID=UPI0018A8B2E6|nr:hypothetical protein [Romboutsia sp. 1001713B170131_170501_G6]